MAAHASTATVARSVRLGKTGSDSIAATAYALLERGVERRPAVALQAYGRMHMRWTENLTPVRIDFGEAVVLVEDGVWEQPDLEVAGRLPHIIELCTAPLLAGWPNPALRRGRAALAHVATGRVGVIGDRGLARIVLRLFEI